MNFLKKSEKSCKGKIANSYWKIEEKFESEFATKIIHCRNAHDNNMIIK
jgi:hypothetical protein